MREKGGDGIARGSRERGDRVVMSGEGVGRRKRENGGERERIRSRESERE